MKISNNDKQLLLLIVLFIASIYFWNSIIVYPIKLFVVLLHEMSHGIAAVLLGGSIHEIQISSQIGGYVLYSIESNWFAEIIIASSGYIGSMFWGGCILILASKLTKKNDKYISLCIGIITLLLSFFVIKSGSVFGTLFCFTFGGFMIFAFKFLEAWFHDLMLKFIGITSCLYVIIDIKSDLIDRAGIGSDADKIAQLTYIPSIVVGIFWIIIAFALLYFIFKKSVNVGSESKNKFSV